ncbi:tRNA (guanosine(37)-N1)-methyltransferase TrmD [Candidatus Saccharibacteria bacterium RIFCSPHIGHO2_12_FULL_41_12]|nr:MAG: tRNA (guanosine(37)-N1)-methyltransferase TrmD [Candidatus Saccharibacteria bacterium RIFCSPHIGHO2_12_FULL_41_12]
MKIQVISIFNDPIKSYLSTSMMRKATDIGAVEFGYIDLRDFGQGPRKQVDDTPYGGGDGMLLMVEPLHKAIGHAKKQDPKAKVYLTTPKAKKLTQAYCREIADEDTGMIIVCGRYEGEDARVLKYIDRSFSIGDYILTGGELPALVLTDSVVRLLPGVLGGETSAEKESFTDGETLEHPHYTRPEEYDGQKVPDVLLSGNHVQIAKWRKDN